MQWQIIALYCGFTVIVISCSLIEKIKLLLKLVVTLGLCNLQIAMTSGGSDCESSK